MARKAKVADPLTAARGICKGCGMAICSATARNCIACERKAVEVPVLTWEGCFEKSWKGVITKASFAHPAKFARGLLERVVDFGLAEGFWRKGDCILDPFGGIATGGIICSSRGLGWIGVELESEATGGSAFVELAQANFELHRRSWEQFGDPTPRIVQGDSRRLREVLAQAGVMAGAISSPPYAQSPVAALDKADASGGQGNAFRKTGKSPRARKALQAEQYTGAMKSPPYTSEGLGHGGKPTTAPHDTKPMGSALVGQQEGYGSTPGQLAAMPQGDLGAVISSPPYASEITGQHAEQESASDSRKKRKTPGGSLGQSARHGGYGVTEGNLSNLPSGVLSSPPYEASDMQVVASQRKMRGEGTPAEETHDVIRQARAEGMDGYGQSQGNLGNEKGQTFWEATCLILLECHAILPLGAVTAWNVKDFCRKGKRVRFSQDWAALLESCGFKVFLWVKAPLIKETSSDSLFGGKETDRKERKSFFRRLHEKKLPSGDERRIDHEDIIFAKKA